MMSVPSFGAVSIGRQPIAFFPIDDALVWSRLGHAFEVEIYAIDNQAAERSVLWSWVPLIQNVRLAYTTTDATKVRIRY